jgi:type III secretion system chaperone SycN
MAEFTAGARMVVEAFAASLGLPSSPARDGSYSFAFRQSGVLTMTPGSDGRTLVSLARKPARPDRALELKALAAARRDPTTNRFLHAGLATDGSLVFTIGLETGELDMPTLDTCFHQLVAVHASVA